MKKISLNTFSEKHQSGNDFEYSKLFFDEQHCYLIKSEDFMNDFVFVNEVMLEDT